MLRLAVLSVLVGTSVYFEQSTFVPFASDRAISYVLCTPPLWRLIVDVLLTAGLSGRMRAGSGYSARHRTDVQS